MAQTNVSSCVLSIVASFTSGLDVLKRFRETRTRRKRKCGENASLDGAELRLARSLRQGPEDIGREYQRSIQAVGDHFASGDATAQTSLAEILLKLNTGLVTIINTFLSRRDQQGVQLDYQSLTSLSEQSRVDTCRTLRRLYQRMMQLRLPLRMSSNEHVGRSQPQDTFKTADGKKRKKSVSSTKHTKVRGPMLARVVIADSAKPSQVALVRPGERKKKPRSSSSSGSSRVQSKTSLVLPAPPTLEPPAPIPLLSSQPPAAPGRPRRKHSAIDVRQETALPKPESLRATRSTPRLDAAKYQNETLPPMPNTSPQPRLEPRRRKPTPTYYSIETTSTKLGEIPLHKWAEPYDFDAMDRLNQEAQQNGWPLNDLVPVQQKKKRGLGLFRMFRRNCQDA